MCFLPSLHLQCLLCLDVVLIRHGTTLLSHARLYIELQLTYIHTSLSFSSYGCTLISKFDVCSGESVERGMLCVSPVYSSSCAHYLPVFCISSLYSHLKCCTYFIPKKINLFGIFVR